MKFTNIYNLPDGMVQALSAKDWKPDPKRMSVTDLINPPLIRTLKIKHFDDITVDVSENLWALLGSAIHYILSQTDGKTELKLEYDYGDYTIVGKLDRYANDIIDDYKITSVWSFLHGVKDDWTSQLNCYDWLAQKTGRGRAKGLRILAILRDWTKSKTVDRDYPRIPFKTLDVPQWPFEEQDEYVSNMIARHKTQAEIECLPNEKWQRESKFAVMKQGQKRAMRVLDSRKDAENWLAAQGNSVGMSVAERPGGLIRCQDYCTVRSVCPYAGGKYCLLQRI